MYFSRVLTVIAFVFFSGISFAKVDDRMNFDFDTITTGAALQVIADFAQLNLIVSDDVTGTINMRMKDVTWEQALNYVVKTKALHHFVSDDVLYVSRDQKYFDLPMPAAPDQVDNNKNTIIKVSYLLPSDAIKGFPLYSKDNNNESLTVNDSAGIVVARFSPGRLVEFKDYLKAVDYPRAQLMIEARIVEVDRAYSKQIGVNWSATVRPGNFAVSSNGAFADLASSAVSTGVGFVSNTLALDAELAAMERDGHGKVISRPRVFASDKQQARVVKGSEVPYQQSAGDGATSVSFKEAALSLDVTPYIDEQGVMLNIKLAKNEADFSNAMNGVPPIKTASMSSNIRVKLGSTVVLGGVYSNVDSTQEYRVPGLASIPYLGRLFRYRSESTTDSELILFITPTLVPAL